MYEAKTLSLSAMKLSYVQAKTSYEYTFTFSSEMPKNRAGLKANNTNRPKNYYTAISI